MRRNPSLACLAISALASVVCPTARAQSVADAARAAKEAKDAKKKTQTDTTDRTAAKPKVYTNDEIPEAQGSRATVSAPAQGSGSAAAAPASSGSAAKTAPDQHPYEWGPDFGHVDFKFTSSSVKRPGTAQTQWIVQNTSNHVEEVALKTVITGPCGYHQDTNSVHKLNSGGSYTDTMQVEFVPLASDCAGTYRAELRFIVDGKVLDSASDSVTVE
jgi:hypothetical protein